MNDDPKLSEADLLRRLRGLRYPDPPATLRAETLARAAEVLRRPPAEKSGWFLELALLATLFLLMLGVQAMAPTLPASPESGRAWRSTLVRALELDPALAEYLDFRVSTAAGPLPQPTLPSTSPIDSSRG